MTPIFTPPGFDRRMLLERLNSEALEHSPEYRRAITRTSPLLFSLVYMLDELRGDETGGRVSFCQMHLDMAREARRWVRSDIGPGEIREVWIGPRGVAKTGWIFLILPLWAMAHEHPVGRFVQAFTDADAQGRKHLRSLRDQLEGNELLQHDFPQLCLPRQNRSDLYVARSGMAIGTAGMGASTLGVKVGNQRPTLLLLDDVEPEQADYDASTKERRLSAITNKILPMSLNAPVWWAGTTTAYGSLVHDLVRAASGHPPAEWVAETGFRPRYYPAIVTAGDGSERSLWPERWPLDYLRSIRGTRMYAMNYANLPTSSDKGLWRPEHIRVEQVDVTNRVLMIDPAVTSRRSSDETGLAVVGVERAGRRRAVVEYATGVRCSPDELRARVSKILTANRAAAPIRRVLVETNNGGDLWVDALRPVLDRFPEARLDTHWSDESKAERFERAHDWYVLDMAVHARDLPRLTDQLLAYPEVAHDDVMDAAAAGLQVFLADRDLPVAAP